MIAMIINVSMIICPALIATESEAIPLFSITEGFFIEVLLNKDDIEYDLDPLDDLVDEGLVNKQEGIFDGFFGEEPTMNEDPFSFLTFSSSYVYRAHLYNETAVIITETNNSFIGEIAEEDVVLKGLSISLMVPMRDETITTYTEETYLDIGRNITLDDRNISMIEDLGFTGSLNVTIPDDHQDDNSTFYASGYLFSKGGLSIEMVFVNTIPLDGEMVFSSLHIIGSNISIEGEIENQILRILDEFSINRSIWNDRNMAYITSVNEYPVPDIDMDLEDIDWGSALRTELEILINYSVIKGLEPEDMDEIAGIAGRGESSHNNVVLYDDGRWTTLGDIIESYLLTLWPLMNIMKEAIPVNSFSPSPQTEDHEEDHRLLIIILSSSALIILIASAVSYTTLKTRSLENNANRKRILDLIENEPGIHFREICRKLDLKQGVLSYHLNTLEKHEMIKSIQEKSYRRFFLCGTKVDARTFLTDIQSSIVDLIMDSPGISKSAVSKKLGRSRPLISYHINILKEARLIEVRKEGRLTTCFPVLGSESATA